MPNVKLIEMVGSGCYECNCYYPISETEWAGVTEDELQLLRSHIGNYNGGYNRFVLVIEGDDQQLTVNEIIDQMKEKQKASELKKQKAKKP